MYWSDLKYALRLQEIIDAIESKYSLTFSSDFFNDATNLDFYNLYMWLHRKKGAVEPATQVTETYQQVSSFTAYNTASPRTSMVTGALIIPSSLVTSPNYMIGNDLTFIPNSSYSGTQYNIRVFRNGSLFYHGVKLPNVTELSAFAEDTLPLNVRTYEQPYITIYTTNYAE